MKMMPKATETNKTKSLPARLNGKPLAHWEAMAQELVVDLLVCASLKGERLMALAVAENPALVQEALAARSRFQHGAAHALAAFLPEPVGKPRKADRDRTRSPR